MPQVPVTPDTELPRPVGLSLALPSSPAPRDPIWSLLLSAVFAACAALTLAAVVILGGPGGTTADPGGHVVPIAPAAPKA